MDFNALHHQPQPLLIANVWDASSALAAEQAGYRTASQLKDLLNNIQTQRTFAGVFSHEDRR